MKKTLYERFEERYPSAMPGVTRQALPDEFGRALFPFINEDAKKYVRSEYGAFSETDQAYLQMSYQCSRFHFAGRKVFEVDATIAEALDSTDLPKIPGEYFKLPFDAFCISFAGDFAKDMFNSGGRANNFAGVMISEVPVVDDDGNSVHGGRLFPIIVYFDDDDFLKGNLGVSIVWMILTDKFNIDGWVDRSVEQICELKPNEGKSFPDILRSLFRVIVNMVMFLASEEVQKNLRLIDPSMPKLITSNKKKVRRYMKQYGHLSKMKYYDVGKIGINLFQKKDISVGERREQWKLNHKFIVRGHWRNQSIKDGHRVIWIKPYFKGPEMADIVSKKYEVKV